MRRPTSAQQPPITVQDAELAALRGEAQPPVPAGLEARVIQRVRARASAARPSPLRGWQLVLLRAAAVVLVFFGIWLGTRLGYAICGDRVQQYEQLIAEEGL